MVAKPSLEKQFEDALAAGMSRLTFTRTNTGEWQINASFDGGESWRCVTDLDVVKALRDVLTPRTTFEVCDCDKKRIIRAELF